MSDNIEDDERELRQLRQAEHRRLLNDIEQARVESAEQSVVEGLRAKGLILSNECADDCHFGDHDAPAALERGEWRVGNLAIHGYRIFDEQGREVVTNIYRKEDAEQIVTEHNQHSTLITQRERLLEAARFALSTPGFIRGRDSLQRIVDEAINTSEQEGRTER